MHYIYIFKRPIQNIGINKIIFDFERFFFRKHKIANTFLKTFPLTGMNIQGSCPCPFQS